MKEHIGGPAAAKPSPMPSASNTPSKPSAAPPPAIQPSNISKASTDDESKADIISDTKEAQEPATAQSNLTSALRQAGFEAAQKAVDAKAKARSEALDAARNKVPIEGIQKLMLGGASTTIAEAEDFEKAASAVEERSKPEAEFLEGSGKAEVKIPNAKEVEESANKAIVEDESQHIHIAGSPPLKKFTLAKADTGEEEKPDSTNEEETKPKEPKISSLEAEKSAARVEEEEVEPGKEEFGDVTKVESADKEAETSKEAETVEEAVQSSKSVPKAQDETLSTGDGDLPKPTAPASSDAAIQKPLDLTLDPESNLVAQEKDAPKSLSAVENDDKAPKQVDTTGESNEGMISKDATASESTDTKPSGHDILSEATRTSDPPSTSPAEKTQEQAAADGAKVGQSVAD